MIPGSLRLPRWQELITVPHTLAREKNLLHALVARDLPLSEVFGYFASGKKADLQAAELGIRRLLSHQLIELRQLSSREQVDFDAELFQCAEDYQLVFAGYGAGEWQAAARNKGRLGPNIEQISEHHYLAAVETASLLDLDGRLEDATVLFERVRAFTHRFALHLINAEYGALVQQFSRDLRCDDAEQRIRDKLQRRQKTEGTYEIFDHVAVANLYNGLGRRATPLDDPDWWPKGTDRKSRRAVTCFQLGSLVTPGGAILDGCYMSLSIVEEDDLLRVRHYRLYTGN